MLTFITGYSKGYISIIILFTLITLASAYYFTEQTSKNNDLNDYSETKRNIVIVNEAIGTYYSQNGYMPCPADLTIKPSNASFMAESRSGGTGSACQTTSGVIASTDSQVYIGAVPTRSLGISLNYSQDIWGSKILYVVTQCMTIKSSYNTCTGGITIQDISADIIDSAASYALISFGPDKMGAYGFQNSSIGLSCSISNAEKANCLYTQSIFVQSTPTFYYSVTNSSYYDDIVFYWNKLGG